MKTKAEPGVIHTKNSLKKQKDTRDPHPLFGGKTVATQMTPGFQISQRTNLCRLSHLASSSSLQLYSEIIFWSPGLSLASLYPCYALPLISIETCKKI